MHDSGSHYILADTMTSVEDPDCKARAAHANSGTAGVFDGPFRRQALANKNQRQQLDHLLRVTAPHERIILAGIGLLLLALAAWVLFGSVVRSVTVDGVIVAPGARYDVVATETGHLAEYLVGPGDRVEAGDPIARQTTPELEREMAALRNRIELLEVETGQAGGGALLSRLAAARVALLQLEARRSARERIVSQIAGEVTALRSAPGEYLPAGAAVAQLRNSQDQALQAVLRVAPRVAQRIRPGMRAAIDVALPDGVTRTLQGRVAAVIAEPLPDWLAALEPVTAEPGHRVDVVLHDAPAVPVPDGTPSRVRIELGRQPPTALFDIGRS